MTDKPQPSPDDWVDLYGDYLYRYALLRLKNPATAEDAVQETFLAAVKGQDRFDGRTDIKFWLRGILRNKIVDHIRKAVREDVVEDTEAQGILDSFWFKHSGVAAIRPAPWQFDPYRAFEKTEFWEIFRSCLDQLREPLRTAFTLKMLEDQSSEEICKILGVSPNNLWVMMHRARSLLKTCLEKKWAKRA
ncbi:MAG: sigma-70 family RNA polymerase sigma factor [Lentisphaerae bacterium]|nr:sigma-70 family RNA polymerase sigma factor [Lentisphaerota bacterium]